MGVTNNTITAPVSIADVESVIGTASHDLGKLCAGRSGTIKWIYNNYYFITSLNPQAGDSCTNNLPGGYSSTVKSVVNGIPTFRINTTDYTPEKVPLSANDNVLNIQIPLCFATNSINKYSVKKPLWDYKDAYATQTGSRSGGINLVDSLDMHKKHNAGLYLKAIRITNFGTVRDLSAANSATNYNFEYILFPRLFSNSTFRLTDFENYKHNAQFPTFYLEDGTPNDIVYTRVWNEDTQQWEGSYSPNSPMTFSFTLPVRCSDTTLLNAIEYPMAYSEENAQTQYPIKSTVVIIKNSDSSKTTLTNNDVKVVYGNLGSDISCNVTTTTTQANFFNGQSFKWMYFLGVDLGYNPEQSSALNFVIPVKGLNLTGSITGTTITKSTTVTCGGGIIFDRNCDGIENVEQSTSVSFNTRWNHPKLGYVYGRYGGSIDYYKAVYNNIACLIGGITSNSNAHIPWDTSITFSESQKSTGSFSLSVPYGYFSTVVCINRQNYSVGTQSTFDVYFMLVQYKNGVKFKRLGDLKGYKFTTTNLKSYYNLRWPITKVGTISAISSGDSVSTISGYGNAVGYSYSIDFTDRTLLPKYDIEYAYDSAYHNKNMDGVTIQLCYSIYEFSYNDIDSSGSAISNRIKKAQVGFSSTLAPDIRIES